MKVTCEPKETFKPVTISITCETPEELFALWHRFNILDSTVWDCSNEQNEEVPNGTLDSYHIWEVINKQTLKLLK